MAEKLAHINWRPWRNLEDELPQREKDNPTSSGDDTSDDEEQKHRFNDKKRLDRGFENDACDIQACNDQRSYEKVIQDFEYLDLGGSTTAVFLIGNTGAGKSLIGNCLLESWEFASKAVVDSCTRKASCADTIFRGRNIRVIDTPGLLEADAQRVRENVRILQKALTLTIPSIVFFVITTEGGRIRNEDIVAYKALKEAYDISKHPVVMLVNKTTKRHDKVAITHYVQRMFGNFAVVFVANLTQIESDQDAEDGILEWSRDIRPVLLKEIQKLQPRQLRTLGPLQLDQDRIEALQKEAQTQKIQYEQELKEMKTQQGILQEQNLRQTKELAQVTQRLADAQYANRLVAERRQRMQQEGGRRRRGMSFHCGPLSVHI